MLIKRKRCGHCDSKKIDKGYYRRGWNNLCNQASGDNGYWCFNCLRVSWVKTYEEATRDKKEWCTVYKNTTVTVKLK